MSKQNNIRYFNRTKAENHLQNDNTQNTRKVVGTADQYVYQKRVPKTILERTRQNKYTYKKESEIDKKEREREQEKPKNSKTYNIGNNKDNLRQSNNISNNNYKERKSNDLEIKNNNNARRQNNIKSHKDQNTNDINKGENRYTKRVIVGSKNTNQEKKPDVIHQNIIPTYNQSINNNVNNSKYNNKYNNNVKNTKFNQRKDFTSIDKRFDFNKLNSQKINYISSKGNEKAKESDEDNQKTIENYKETEKYLCHTCQGKVLIELNPNSLSVNMKCENNHVKNKMPIKEFYAKNELNKKKVICSECRQDNFQKDLFFCSCNKNICKKCKRSTHKVHLQIPFSEKCYDCTKHQQKYMSYCSKCNINICNDCLKEHKTHNQKIIYFDDLMPKEKDIKECKRNLEKTKKNKKDFDDKVDKFIETLKNKKKNFDQNYENFIKLQNDLLNSMENKESLNYENIMNFKNLNILLSTNQNDIIRNYLDIKNNFVNEGQYLSDILGENISEKTRKKPNEKINTMKIVSKEQNFNILKERKKNKVTEDKNTNLRNSMNRNKVTEDKNTNLRNSINRNKVTEDKDTNLRNSMNRKKVTEDKDTNLRNSMNKNKNKITEDKNANIQNNENKIIGDLKTSETHSNKKGQNVQDNLTDVKLKNEKELLKTENINETDKDINIRAKESAVCPAVKKEITVLEKIENCKLKLNNKDERCITSFAILRNNRILLTFKGGIIKIYEFEKNPNSPADINNPNEIQLKEIVRLEEEEYCFNYGIEFQNGNIGVCSEDGTVKIIQLFLDEKPKDNIKYKIIQKINEQNQDPIYTMKELINEGLILGCWKNILLFQKANEYQLINKLFMGDYTFSIIELSPNVIVASHSETKTLTVYDLNEYDKYTIEGVESNENNNIICKYNNENDIIFVAYDKGINIVSITKKCLIKKIELNEIISSLCPMELMLDTGDGKTKKVFGLLCGAKRNVYGEKVNFAYSFLQIGFNINNEDKGEINSTDKDIEYKIISRKDRIHYYDVTNIYNSLFNINNNSLKINENKNDQWIFSSGSEDKLLKIWKL